MVLVRVLPAAFNRYVDGLRDLIVDRADGRPVDGLAGLIAALEENRGPFHVIEFEGEQAPLVLDAAAVEEGNDEVLRRYGIARDRDLAVPEGGGGR